MFGHRVRKASKLKSKRGAALVEFAIIAMLLFTLVLGIIDFSLMMKSYLALSQVAREAARSAGLGDDTGTVTAKITSWANNLGLTGPLVIDLRKIPPDTTSFDWNSAQPLGDDNSQTPVKNDAESGGQVRVRLTYTYSMATGSFFAPIVGGETATLTTSMVMRRE